jgi:hypothetical protein
MLTLMLLALSQSSTPTVDGSRLTAGTTCYALLRGEAVFGATFQKVTAASANGAPAWEVVVHQRGAGGAFDLRDHFVLDAKTLQPIAFDSRKSGAEHVRVVYSAGKAVMTRDGATTETALSGPVWEGNLWGLTIAALPLAEGAHFDLPIYQYDKGSGSFSLHVVGSEKVAGEDAWVVEATADGKRKVRYLLGKQSHAELGYGGGGFASRPGGDCSGMGGK